MRLNSSLLVTMRLDLTEHGPTLEAPLPTDVGVALAGTKLVDAHPTPGSRLWSLKPGAKVGAVSIGGVEIHVAPKVPIDRVVFLLAFGHGRVSWRQDTVQVKGAPELLVAVVEAYERLTSKALLQGLLQGYRSVDEALAVVRGRIREADQVKRRFAMPLPVEVRYDDFTADITENRLLRTAAHRSVRLPCLPAELRHRLRRLNLQLADVTLVEPKLLESWQPSRLNARLHDALRLAEVIVAGSSFETAGSGLAVTGFVVDMAKVFEDFICTTLGERLRLVSGTVRTQDPWFLDRAGAVRMKPDLVWYADDGSPAAVIDAKYKAEKPEGFPDADLYQMLAYCTAMRLPVGNLVYAKGNEQGATHQVVGADVTLRAHTIDLSASPHDLLADIDRLADRIAVGARRIQSPSRVSVDSQLSG
jgi:5-methylcytosine-specific restriction enzyme subunit McrC